MLASRKWSNTARAEKNVNKTNVLPIVLIRDFYSWGQSMCRHPYGVTSTKSNKELGSKEAGPCPKFLASEEEGSSSTMSVTIPYPNRTATFDSIAHFWSQWYNEYLEADFPRLIIRFEGTMP